MVITKKQATKFPVNPNHAVWDYPMPNKEIGFSYQEINGETPEGAWWKNTVCEEWYFVISGSGIVYIEDTREECHQGDIIILPVHKKHKIVGNKLCMIATTKPDWYEEQAEIIPDKNKGI